MAQRDQVTAWRPAQSKGKRVRSRFRDVLVIFCNRIPTNMALRRLLSGRRSCCAAAKRQPICTAGASQSWKRKESPGMENGGAASAIGAPRCEGFGLRQLIRERCGQASSAASPAHGHPIMPPDSSGHLKGPVHVEVDLAHHGENNTRTFAANKACLMKVSRGPISGGRAAEIL